MQTTNHRGQPRVVVTGLGAVTSLGQDVPTYWGNLLAGKSGITRLARFDPEPFSCQVAGQVEGFEPTDWMDAKEVRRNDRYIHFAVAASKMAMRDSGLAESPPADLDRFGVIDRSGIGGMETIESQSRRLHEQGPRKVSPFMIPMLIANSASGVVAIEFSARGPNYAVVSACTTGSHAITESLRIIRTGDADVMLAGGSEASITPLGFAGFCNMKAMSTKSNEAPERASRPFDRQRDGFVMGEGAGLIVLETLEHALNRGARIYAEIVGCGVTCDAFHITAPDPSARGLSMAIRAALKESGLQGEEIDYINAHGTSTPYNDRMETHAIKETLGAHARKVAISSTKSMTGHLLGASGGIEAIAAVKAIETNEIPPTINYQDPDPECDLEYVPNKKISRDVRVALSNNLGFGGHNTAILFRRLEA